jgi:hypothetical protein
VLYQTKVDCFYVIEIGHNEEGIQNKIYLFISFYKFYATDNSGYRRNLSIRNDSIRKEHRDGSTISDLAEKYYLSENTIKKIVYVKINPVTGEREHD